MPHQPALPQAEEDARWAIANSLPCEIALEVPVPHFTVGDLLRMSSGTIVDTHWDENKDVPLKGNGTLIGWAEFEVAGDQLAVRLTELA
ncbi:MAG TPA: FliM/FliN family flagellar motor C-terminal domain-containing protein [Terriglobales bacterium]|nr:FliM/FliN family flagellar motor C-terminal domain-containing protein [Terriglobales bacterium]